MAGNLIDVKRESRNLPPLCSTTIFFILYKKTQVHGKNKNKACREAFTEFLCIAKFSYTLTVLFVLFSCECIVKVYYLRVCIG